jgi:hypothetical protein
VSTILLPFLTDLVEHHTLRLAGPPLSVAAQGDTGSPFLIGGIVLLLLALLVVFWRMRRKPRGAAPAPAEPPGEPPAQAAVPPTLQPGAISLEFVAESGQRSSFMLDKPTLTIGRAPDNDIVLAAPILSADSVSLHHARLRRDQDSYVVRDLGSRNGLAVNGRQTIENLLQDGDRLQFGEAEAIFHQPAGGAA